MQFIFSFFCLLLSNSQYWGILICAPYCTKLHDFPGLVLVKFWDAPFFKQVSVELVKWSAARTCQICYRLGGLVLVLLFRRFINVLEQKQLWIKAYFWAWKNIMGLGSLQNKVGLKDTEMGTNSMKRSPSSSFCQKVSKSLNPDSRLYIVSMFSYDFYAKIEAPLIFRPFR